MILGMDLSLSSPGFSVVERTPEGIVVRHLSSIKTNPKKTHGQRLIQIFDHLEAILKDEELNITKVVSEKGFSRHATTTQALFKVHGVAHLLCAIYGHGVVEMSPTTVKKHVSGNGKASKEQLADAVRGFIRQELHFKNDDESDAVAVVVAWLVQNGELTT